MPGRLDCNYLGRQPPGLGGLLLGQAGSRQVEHHQDETLQSTGATGSIYGPDGIQGHNPGSSSQTPIRQPDSGIIYHPTGRNQESGVTPNTNQDSPLGRDSCGGFNSGVHSR